MDVLHVVCVEDGHRDALDDLARIDVVIQEERRDARLGVAVDDGPVDGRSATVLRQKRRVEVESSLRRHIPHHFGEHSEGYDNLQVGFKRTKFIEERFVLQLLGLEHLETLLDGIFLHGRLRELRLMASDGLVRHRHHAYNIISALDKGF